MRRPRGRFQPGPNGEDFAELTDPLAAAGDRGLYSNFHFIDLRGVKDQLSCLECRKRDDVTGEPLAVGGALCFGSGCGHVGSIAIAATALITTVSFTI